MPVVSKKAARLAIQRHEALELRRAGLSYAQIANQMGIGVAAAHRMVHQEHDRLTRRTQEKRDLLIYLAQTRRERLLAAHWTRALQGNPKSTEAALRILQQLEALQEIAPPTKVAPTNPDGTTPYSPLTDEDRADRLLTWLADQESPDPLALISPRRGKAATRHASTRPESGDSEGDDP